MAVCPECQGSGYVSTLVCGSLDGLPSITRNDRCGVCAGLGKVSWGLADHIELVKRADALGITPEELSRRESGE